MYWDVKYKIASDTDNREHHIIVCDVCLLECEIYSPEIDILAKNPTSPEDVDYDENNCMNCYGDR